jgi:signal transduction histidine kinase
MARPLKSISSRLVLAVLLVNAALLPLLVYGLLTVVRSVQEDVFIDHVRIYARSFADMLLMKGQLQPEAELQQHLDSSMLSGRCVHAELDIDGTILTSTLMDASDTERFVEDYHFGEHGDGIYYLSLPMQLGDKMAILRLGFDELPTQLQIESARRTILYIVAAYVLLSVVLVLWLGSWLARPLQRLRQQSRMIASGDYARRLSVTSDFAEIADLSRDLEEMRSALVGAHEELQKEIASREAAEAERRKAEIHLRHMHRLQSIGTLAGGIAHEFNNVLLPLLLYTDLALEDLPPDSAARPHLERVMRLANRAKGLSEQILTFGRQAEDTHKVAMDMSPTIAEAMSMVRALVPANIDIRLNLDSEVGAVLGDPNEVQQLVVNLCSNAYQALAKGGGVIAVSVDRVSVSEQLVKAHPRLHVGDYVRLRVRDTGEGMDADTVERIFDPFYTTREVGKGTGLGLSVVHGIVVKHEGDIIVASKVGEGTTVDVYFPVADNELKAGMEGQVA